MKTLHPDLANAICNCVEAINREASIAQMADGSIVPVVCWLDSDGEESTPIEAIVAIAGPDRNDTWHTILLSQFEQATIH